MRPRQRRPQGGFSLIEVAIVLVVIGTILGTVLQGRSMIASAEFKSFRQQLREYRGAFDSFRDRYDALPGDVAEAAARFGGPNPPAASGGNGIIDNGPDCVGATQESCLAWQHLRFAGMLDGNPQAAGGDASPAHPFVGVIASFFTGAQGNGVFGHKLYVRDLPVNLAMRLDRVEDNGLCDSGRVALVPSADCVDGGDSWPADGTVDLIYAL